MKYLILLLFVIGCANYYEPVQNNCVPSFQAKGEWLAADGGRSVYLPNNKSVFLFGDTITSGGIVGNSIAFAGCNEQEFDYEYIWNDDKPFFDMEMEGIRLWPVDGFYAGGKAHFILTKIVNVEHGFGFTSAGSVLASVNNPLAHPSLWDIKYEHLTWFESYKLTKGIVIDEGYAYVYADTHVIYDTILLRMPLNNLNHDHMEFLSDDGFKSVKQFDNPTNVMYAPSNSYVEKLGDKWVSFQAYFGSGEILMKEAKNIEGPWSGGEIVYEIPEVEQYKEQGASCYAVAEHSWLRQEDNFVITYSCNTFSTDFTLEHLDMYRPKTIMVQRSSEE